MSDLVDAAITGSEPVVKKITSETIKLALRTHFAPPAYATFYEVSNDTGTKARTWTDVVVVGIWPSTGQEIVGIEIKVSRSDWLREVKNPAKTSPMFNNCDRFYLACPSGMVPASEVPQNWGVLHFDGSRIKVAKKAPPLEPQPLSRGLMAAILRRAGAATDSLVSVAVQRALEVQRAEENRRVELAVLSQVNGRRSDEDTAKRKLAKIEEITGIKMDGWAAQPETVGRAIKAVHDSGVEGSYKRLHNLHRQLRTAADDVARALAEAGVEPDKLL